MMEFLDRVEELQRVKEFLSLKEGAFACLYGRRRVGKSRLLKEASAGRADVVMHIADKSDQVLQRGRLARDLSRLIPGFDRVDYPDWGGVPRTMGCGCASGQCAGSRRVPLSG